MRRIAVCGLGKLGACLAATFAASEVPVTGLDIDLAKVESINRRRPPVAEPDLAEYLELPTVRENLHATANPAEAVAASDGCFFVTPTPSLASGAFDHGLLLTALTSVAREVARQRRRRYVFVVTSTVMPGFMTQQAQLVLRRLLEGLSFGLAYKPELIALGTVIRDLHYPDVMIIGADSEETGAAVEGLYRQMTLLDRHLPARHLSLVEAELAKIALNCAVTMKISFANQVGLVAARLGADPARVLSAVGDDRRVGHAALAPGLPFGGPCFPRDNRMFQHVAASCGERAPLAEATDLMNRHMLRALTRRVPGHGDVGILGLAYKPGTAVSEESPGMWLRHILMSAGRRVRSHDPQIQDAHTHPLAEVLACPTVIVACAWPEYKRLTFSRDTVLLDPFGATAGLRTLFQETELKTQSAEVNR